MNIQELVDAAVKNSGTAQADLAKELDLAPARISEIKSGKRKTDTNEMAFFADKAGLAVMETIAQIEAELNPRYAMIWKKAVSQLRQNRG
jgi:ribosome-binding protein aMBF1 (putative translation factor)